MSNSADGAKIGKRMKKASPKPLPTGHVLAIMGLKYRTLYNYLRDYGEYFSEGAKSPKKGKRWTSEDLIVIQTVRHLHNERLGSKAIKQQLSEGYKTPLGSGYKPEDINRLIEASWIMLGETDELLEKTELLFNKCALCEFDARRYVNNFLETMMRYEEFDRELKQIKLIVGRVSDSHRARQWRDEEYERLHKWIRFKFLSEEERRVRHEEQYEKELTDRTEVMEEIKSKILPGYKNRKEREEQQEEL